jgi:sulfoquinovosyltransferase
MQGMMKGEALSQAYASGDVFVMPSESETLGFVALEAMASRVPVVAVAAGGLTDIITRPGENGALFVCCVLYFTFQDEFESSTDEL